MIPAVAFAAMLAMAPGADAFGGRFAKRFAEIKKRAGNNPVPSGYGPVKVDRQHSSVKCTAVAYTKNFKKSVDAHVQAITYAFAYACEEKPDKDWLYAIKDKMRYAYAEYDAGLAYAKAIAAAKTECKSNGNAWGCAAAYAYSAAWADAVVSAHASAWSEALASCNCDGEVQDVGATTDGYAHELRNLNAKVSSYADAHICVDGDDYGYDYDAKTCVQDIYSTVFAKSVSLAVIKGKCVSKKHWGGDEKALGEFYAVSKAKAVAEIDTYEIEGCVGYIDLYNPYH